MMVPVPAIVPLATGHSLRNLSALCKVLRLPIRPTPHLYRLFRCSVPQRHVSVMEEVAACERAVPQQFNEHVGAGRCVAAVRGIDVNEGVSSRMLPCDGVGDHCGPGELCRLERENLGHQQSTRGPVMPVALRTSLPVSP